ncbi:MAG: TetR family transcriptional regulator C-terminal domain-containing protein [Pseudomonadota bacterium]
MTGNTDTSPTQAPTLGRPRSFDAAAALDAAIAVFHRDGLRGATYPALEAATGLHRQSLVYAFGDKRAFFEKALERYFSRRVDTVVAALDGRGADGIRAAFALWLGDAQRAEARGCLAVNTAGELAGREPGASRVITRQTRRLVTAFAASFARARAEGRLKSPADPAALASAAVALADGALLHARNDADAALAEAGFDAFLDSLLT